MNKHSSRRGLTTCLNLGSECLTPLKGVCCSKNKMMLETVRMLRDEFVLLALCFGPLNKS
jgi:hypothetical protein